MMTAALLERRVYGACCGRFLGEFAASGTLTAPAPEQLMRFVYRVCDRGCGVPVGELASEYSPDTLELEG